MRTWKVASGGYNSQFIDWIVQTGDPVILSTGLSDSHDFDPYCEESLMLEIQSPYYTVRLNTQPQRISWPEYFV